MSMLITWHLVIAIVLLNGCVLPQGELDKQQHYPSTVGRDTPLPRADFLSYIKDTRDFIKLATSSAGMHLSDDVIRDRGPFQYPNPDEPGRPESANSGVQCSGRKNDGVLLIHGLLDTPYVLQDIGKRLFRQGFCVRAPLLPGHGTVPGDLLKIKRDQWLEAVRLSVKYFSPDVKDLHILGYSTGATLALKYVLHNADSKLPVKSLVLLAPGIKPRDPKARFANWHKLYSWFIPEGNWASLHPQEDDFKYESFAKNAGDQFHLLSKDVRDEEILQRFRAIFSKSKMVTVPVLMIASAQDITVDTIAAQEFFCQRVATAETNAPVSQMIIYYAKDDKGHGPDCGGISYRPSDNFEGILDFSHLTLPVSPSNPHYGVRPNAYKNCLHYYPNEEFKLRLCKDGTNNNVRSGEVSKENLSQYIVRRLTFNPDFDHMFEEIIRFFG